MFDWVFPKGVCLMLLNEISRIFFFFLHFMPVLVWKILIAIKCGSSQKRNQTAFGWFLLAKKIDILYSSSDLFIVDSPSVAFQDRKHSIALSAQNFLFALAINNESLCRSTLEVLLLFWQLGLASAPSFLWRFILPRHSLNTDNVDPLASMVMLERGIFLLSSPCSLKAYWIMRQPNGNNLHEYSASLFKVNVIWRRVKNISKSATA